MPGRSLSWFAIGLAALIWCPVLQAQVGVPPASMNNAPANAFSLPPALAVPPNAAPLASCPCDPQAAPPQVDNPPAPFTPFMLGDFVGFVANQFSDVKIAEGESPRPLNRVFYRFNWYDNVAPAQWADPTKTIHNVNLYRNVFGFEQTFFDGRFSLGLRIPFNTIDAEPKHELIGDQGINSTQFGNVSAIFKAVLWEDRPTGDLVSAGVTLSLPTASSKLINPGQSVLGYVQPFGGFILNSGVVFVQGFLSITAPLASAESIVLFADLGAGWWLYRNPWDAMLTGIAPTVELHLADPLRQVDPSVLEFGIFDNLKLHNVLDVTVGSTFEFASRATLGVGLAFPLTAPRPFDMELLAQFNYRF